MRAVAWILLFEDVPLHRPLYVARPDIEIQGNVGCGYILSEPRSKRERGCFIAEVLTRFPQRGGCLAARVIISARAVGYSVCRKTALSHAVPGLNSP